jgi:mono/diheme cytochrome c family protein
MASRGDSTGTSVDLARQLLKQLSVETARNGWIEEQTMSRTAIKLTMAFVSFIAALGCSSSPPEPAPEAAKGAAAKAVPAADAQAEADKIFMTRCASCHGIDGRGDGPGAANLNPKPRNYHDKAWQKSVTDEHIKKTIVYGGAAVGKSPSMAANPDLAAKPEVVNALCEHVRAFGQQ